jgi:hypothetical protein
VNFLFRIAVSKSLGRGRARHLLANRLVASVPTISMAIALCASGAPGMAADSNGPADSVNGSAPAGNSSGGDIVKLGLLVVSDSSSDASALPSRPLSSVFGVEQSILDSPRAITEVTSEELKFDPVHSYGDFVKYTPSVNFNTEMNGSRAPSIRGAPGDVYQDGLWLAPARHPFEQNSYESVDIVAGPAGVIFGPTQRTSSYINYTTKQPYFDKQQTEIDVTFGDWVTGGGSFNNLIQDIDTGGPIIPGKLAYRASLETSESDTYYQGIKAGYWTLFTALGWRPTSRLSVDFNLNYGSYDYTETRGWDRVTQDLIDNGNYITGTAVPIIRGGPTGFYSAVVDSAGNVTGYVTRVSLGGGKYKVGTAYTPPATATASNTVFGWVLNPTGIKKIYGWQDESNPETDFSHTTQLIAQEAVRDVISDNLTLSNSTVDQRYEIQTVGEGMFIYATRSDYGENRTEAKYKNEYKVLGQDLKHDSDTGFSLRWSRVYYVSGSPGAFWSSPIDILGSEPIGVNGLFGTTVINPAVGNPGKGGPVTTKFGSIWFPAAYPTDFSGVYTTPGVQSGSVGRSKTLQPSFFTQHNFLLNDQWGLDLGSRLTYVEADIGNPYPDPSIPKTLTLGATGYYWLPAETASLTYKPTKQSSLYLTYGYSLAINGYGSGTSGLSWDSSTGTTIASLGTENFHSVSAIYELGYKIELIPNKLFATIDAYHQTRVLPIQTVNGIGADSASERVQGIESTIRYQPNRNFSAGLNYSYLDAIYINYAAAVQTPYGFVADNETVFSLTSGAGILPVKNYRLSGVPRSSDSVYAAYRFDNGFGIKTSVWYQTPTLYKIATNVIIPAQYNVDVSLSYQRPRWFAQIDLMNLTNQHNFATLGVDSVDFIQPLAPLALEGKFGIRF